ncbi:MAG: 16S rRNA (guanine(527)-N(7))-methyltransferase RsmG [Solirubrobacteraceae bacterium]
MSFWHEAAGDSVLSAHQRQQLATVLELLETDPHAPTAIRAPEEAARAHVADSLVALELEAVRSARQIADLGSGAGFPGLALAVALPGAHVSLVESQRRKCEFLERVRSAADIENASVVWARVEEWREGVSRNDVVVARALAPQTVVLEYAAPLLRKGGALVDWRGRRSAEAEAQAERAATVLGLRRQEIRRVAPFAGVTDHHLHVFRKVHETPPRFPRRAGIARKRPLGA